MQRVSYDLLRTRLHDYEHLSALFTFVRRVVDELHPVALILFGSLTKGTYYLHHSDADVCLILAEPEISWEEGYERVASLDEDGIVQPMVYGTEQFLKMLQGANFLALEVCHDGWVLAGDEEYVQQLEEAFEQARERYGLEKTASGWLRQRLK
jgi:hypothetical protein